MCKINGHNLFTYLFQPALKASKTFNSKSKAATAQAIAEKNKAEEQTAELNKPDATEYEGEMPSPITPVKTQGTGLNSMTKVGLNLI